MTSARKLDKKLLIPALALLGTFVIGADALSAQAKAKATRSPSGGSSASSGTPSRSSSGTMSRSASSPRATSPSSGAVRRASPRAVDTRQSTPASRGRRGGSGGHYYPRYHHNIGLHFGYGWGGYWGGYYYPYYYSPFYWGVPYYVPRRAYGRYELGAFDLNVKPKKTEVYLDGQYIGTAGQFDGFPDHLWLEEGSYELIFYRPGLATERRVLSIYPGVVVDVRLRLEPGESVDPAEITSVDRAEGAVAEVREAYQRQQVEARTSPPPARAELDTRAAPGRVRLSVLPADASVYLDGRLLGSGDELRQLHAGLVVEAGNHMIEVVRPGYASKRLEFAVEAGDEVDLEVLLEAG